MRSIIFSILFFAFSVSTLRAEVIEIPWAWWRDNVTSEAGPIYYKVEQEFSYDIGNGVFFIYSSPTYYYDYNFPHALAMSNGVRLTQEDSMLPLSLGEFNIVTNGYYFSLDGQEFYVRFPNSVWNDFGGGKLSVVPGGYEYLWVQRGVAFLVNPDESSKARIIEEYRIPDPVGNMDSGGTAIALAVSILALAFGLSCLSGFMGGKGSG
jgi:hypothetical protein